MLPVPFAAYPSHCENPIFWPAHRTAGHRRVAFKRARNADTALRARRVVNFEAVQLPKSRAGD
jgi:hypothetical protein